MFNKSQPWQTGIKIFSKLFGLETQDDQPPNTNKNKGANGIMTYHSNPETLPHQPQHKTFQIKQKWRKLMKFPSKAKHKEVVQLLSEGSAIEDQTWVWMLKNTQKISPQLYTQRKQQFTQLAYPKSPSSQNVCRFPESATQINDFQQDQHSVCNNVRISRHQRKRKFSITKNGLFLKHGSELVGKGSVNSQCSTFSAQTHSSNEALPQKKYETNQSSIMDAMLCSKYRLESSQSVIKSSMISSYSTPTSPFSVEENFSQSKCQELSSFQSQIMTLPQKITHPVLTSIIGAFLVHRQDFTYSITVFNMAATFFYYTNSSEIKTFILLNHVACSEFFVHYLTKNWEETARSITWIAQKIRKIQSLSHQLRNFRLENFIQNWLYGFFYSICENGSEVKQKIMGYLLINNFTIDCITNLCQSLVLSMSKTIGQGVDERTYECLECPKFFIDKRILFENLLKFED